MAENKMKVTWYGERGIVNSIVVGLQRADISIAKEFLKGIQWAEGPVQDWIERIQSIEMLVEVGCSNFGSPDLIMVCKTEEERPYCVFIEAKVIGYEDSAKSIKKGMRNKQFNSSINGQISLKYRMAIALSQWSDQKKNLIEPNDLFEKYKSWNGFNEDRKKPRRLNKGGVLKLLGAAGLGALPLKQFRFVALTWDNKAFFEKVNFPQSDKRPPFLDDHGKECWEAIRSQVGWLGFSKLNEQKIVDYLGEDFTNASNTMLIDPTPVQIEGKNYELIGKNTSSDVGKKLKEMIEEIFQDKAVRLELKGDILNVQAKNRSKGRIKIFGEKKGDKDIPEIFLGVSASLGRKVWGDRSFDEIMFIEKEEDKYRFYILNLGSNLNEAVEIICRVIADFIE